MNRRDFINISTSSIVLSSTQSLFAMPEPDMDTHVRDSLTLKHEEITQDISTLEDPSIVEQIITKAREA